MGSVYQREIPGPRRGTRVADRVAAPVPILVWNRTGNVAVSSDNLPARRLYEAMGFEKYGCEARALKIGDSYVDGKDPNGFVFSALSC